MKTVTKTLEVEDVSCGNNKVLICHNPSGKEGNAQTICINENALATHLAHGDCIGSCNSPLARMGNAEENEKSEIKNIPLSATFMVYPNPFKDATAMSFAIPT